MKRSEMKEILNKKVSKLLFNKIQASPKYFKGSTSYNIKHYSSKGFKLDATLNDFKFLLNVMHNGETQLRIYRWGMLEYDETLFEESEFYDDILVEQTIKTMNKVITTYIKEASI